MRPAGTGLALFASVALVTFVAVAPARAQQPAQDAAVPAEPAETACVASTLGSDCQTANATGGGGTCLSGCCCHYVSSPEGSQVCAACLACSDTSNKDPAFTTGACSDGGGTSPPDSGVVSILDSGSPLTPPSAAPAPTTGCACTNAGARGGIAASAGALLFGAALLGALRARARRRTR